MFVPCTRSRPRQGAVLVVVLGVLTILALLATTFALIQSTERSVSRSYLDGVRARLLARSGIEDGVARLKDLFPARSFDPANKAWRYYGNSLDETQPAFDLPLYLAGNPSFAHEDEALQNPSDDRVRPRQVVIERKNLGFSGMMDSGTYGPHADHFALKVTDLSGCLHVNDGIENGPDGSVSQNLKRILNILGQMLGVPDLGSRIVAARPADGYRTKQALLSVLNQEEFAKVRDYLTTYAWVDPNVANPVPLSEKLASLYPVQTFRGTPRLFRLNRSRDAAGKVFSQDLQFCPPAFPTDNSIKVYGLDQLNPQWIEIVRRAPVNVNTAPRPVLVALLSDLRGFFLSDRRRNNPRWSGDLYQSFRQQNSHSPDGTEGDEIGFLYQTRPIVGPGSTVTDGISAFVIADEIIACRDRRSSPNPPHIDYAAVPWAGPFQTWRQWNRFCDSLVETGLLKDDRPIFFDYDPQKCDATGHGPLIPSDFQRQFAARAIADVLKSNFNPNLHLNELNPDENLYTVVDKTDLIVNSTEFCFISTGHFEIQSLGRVLRPVGHPDALLAPNNQIQAQALMTATVKLFETYRETNQRQFAAGTCADRRPSPGNKVETNNNLSVEIGPEPDNGSAPSENEWSGYVALPTVGGNYHSAGATKPRNALMRASKLPNEKQFDSAMHGHFSWDFDLHHHELDVRPDLGSTTQQDETVENFADPLPNGAFASYGGPYDPTDGAGNVHRLARSFRLRSGSTNPSLAPFAPSDLRIDGGYTERHAAPAYALSQGSQYIWKFTEEQPRGMVSFWLKPSFFPELTGKTRALWDLSRYHSPCGYDVYVSPFALWFFPSHYRASIAEVNQPWYWSNNIGKFHPASFVFGSKAWHNVPSEHAFGNLTRSLNHVGHSDDDPRLNPLKAHRWLNVTFWWRLQNPRVMEPEWGGLNSAFLINGRERPYAPYTISSMNGWPSGGDRLWYFENHDGGDRNHLRLGNPSKIGNAPGTPFRGNHTADVTVDELYVWKTESMVSPQTVWRRGRYYKPIDVSRGEGMFTSQEFALRPSSLRVPPPPSSAEPPTRFVPTSPTPYSSTSTTSSAASPLLPTVRVLGLSWTWYGEDVDKNLTPRLLDHNTSPGTDPNDVAPKVELAVRADGTTYGFVAQDGFSRTVLPKGGPLDVRDFLHVQYVAEFKLPKADCSTILLATPVLDDVTVYWDSGQIEFLSFVSESGSFP
ncbi:MAG: hypothetical protein HYY16_05235 [Planctomycetes bacterium]|nr:hypothetical protein [Planctomycetota bacterium]